MRDDHRMAGGGHVVHGVDLLRFASALMVAMFHLSFWIGRPNTTPSLVTGGIFAFPHLARFTSVGRMGVEVFFVVSGFVIAFSAQSATAGSFLRGRVLRLAPGAWICATLTLAVAALVRPEPLLGLAGDWVRSVTFSPYGGYIDSVYWTLAIEASFYLVIFVLLRLGAMAQIDRVFLAIALASTAFGVGVFVIDPQLQALARDRTLELVLVIHGGEFAVGVFLWRLLYLGITPTRIAGFGIGLLGGGLETAKFVTEAHDRVLALGLWLGAIGFIILSVRLNPRIHALLSPAQRGWLRALGLATYPLYLLHQTAGAALMRALASVGTPHVACLALTMVAVLAAALVVALRLEPPLRLWLRGVLGGEAVPAWRVERPVPAPEFMPTEQLPSVA